MRNPCRVKGINQPAGPAIQTGGRGDARSGMTDKDTSPRGLTLQEVALLELEAALERHRREQGEPDTRREGDARTGKRIWGLRKPGWRLPFNPWFMFDRRHPIMRKASVIGIGVIAVIAIACGALAWRLSSGPIMLDVATPWLTSAIEKNFGNKYRVQVGGTQLERDPSGRTALRLRDIVLYDAANGGKVAAAPKAEVWIAGSSLLVASPRAESFRLVDANMTIQIEQDGRVNFVVGGDRPFTTIEPNGIPHAAAGNPGALSLAALGERSMAANLAALVGWIDSLGTLTRDGNSTGFDGEDLKEIGISNAHVTIDDRRNGSEWKFRQINISLIRPKNGGVALSIGSDNAERPWLLNAGIIPRAQGNRFLQLEARKVLLDDLLALRMSEARLRSDTLVSASIESEIATDGTLQSIAGSIIAEGGSIGDPDDAIPITNAEVQLDWDASRRTLRVPFKINAGNARITLRSEFAAPQTPGANWMFAVGGGWIVLDPPAPDDEGLVLKRVVVRGQIDTGNQRIILDQGDFGTKELGSKDDKDVTFALSGIVGYGQDGRVALGLAGNQMSAATLKRIWPLNVAPKVRDWVNANIISGTVERLDVATNAPLATLFAGGPPVPDEGLAVEIIGSGAVLRPVNGLPLIREADMNVRMTGRTAVVSLGKGVIEVSPGRRMAVTNGVFEVPDMRPTPPQANVRFRLEGPVPAAAELLTVDRLREFSGSPFDPATTRGTLSAQINLTIPLRADLPRGSTQYNMVVDLTNFTAEKLLFGQKVESPALRITATNQRYEIKGDVKIANTPATIEYRKVLNDPDAELRLAAVVDDAARQRIGLDVGPMLAGSVPIKLSGRIGSGDRDSRFNVEADLTPAKLENLLPGWVKPAGKPARAMFLMTKEKNAIKFDDLLVDGPGVLAKGTVELDVNGELVSANFPVFATSDGDKASVKASRGADGALKVEMRGDVYDGRAFVKTAMAGPNDPKIKAKHPDLDLDIKIGVVAGHFGETIRGLDLRMARRGGRVRTFNLNAKIGRDTPLIGDIRTRVANGKPVLYVETNDAGALFRFTDIYSRMVGGKMWVGMDPPTQDATPQEGLINVRDFTIRGEAALDRVVAGQASNGPRTVNSVDFSQARADFTRIPGRMSIRDGVVRGPTIGATIEGNIDYVRDDVNVRGTLVPLYGLNNMFGQIPIVGLFLGGGSNEGIFGITYEVTGSTANPRPQVNPISAIAPGLLRKFFEFRDNSNERTFAEPQVR